MPNDITIPAAVIEEGALVIARADEDTPFGDIARAAFLAMLRAWPGMTHMEPDLANGIIILPLPPQESQR